MPFRPPRCPGPTREPSPIPSRNSTPRGPGRVTGRAVGRLLAVGIAVALSSAAVLPAASAATVTPVAGTTAAGPTTSAAAPAAGKIAIRLLDVPVSARTNPRARSYIVDQLKPKTTIVRRVVVTNQSASTQTVSVYAAAAGISGGRFTFADGANANELTSWMSVPTKTMVLRAGAPANEPVTIAVPAGVTNAERYAVLWAQVSSAPSAGSVAETNRVGIRVYLDVSGGSTQTSAFTVTGLAASRTAAGVPQVSATVLNTGQRALDVAGTLDLRDGPSGLAVGPTASSATTTLVAGDTQAVLFTLGKELPAGPWTATVALASGLVRHSATAKLTFPTKNQPNLVVRPIVSENGGGSSTAVWLAIGAGVAAVLAVLGGWIWFARRSPRGIRTP